MLIFITNRLEKRLKCCVPMLIFIRQCHPNSSPCLIYIFFLDLPIFLLLVFSSFIWNLILNISFSCLDISFYNCFLNLPLSSFLDLQIGVSTTSSEKQYISATCSAAERCLVKRCGVNRYLPGLIIVNAKIACVISHCNIKLMLKYHCNLIEVYVTLAYLFYE